MPPMNHTPAVAGVWFYIRLSPGPLPTKPRPAERERMANEPPLQSNSPPSMARERPRTERERTAKGTPLHKATARRARPTKDPAPNKTPQITKTKPNEDTKRPGAKNPRPHGPHQSPSPETRIP
ncbi:hypothetical protein BS47DRAFT_1364902 [Hydnum rufescens UP504]|uniref:Uncharacterized protein n=1 Tax=Hydnum rufescens UP504 TaxID=1448309 RepID=A0A9P6ASF5_9AGAM|nr:hypothetical protein BS47DRAFT_1364902 [Hydnum rufescens UP504]